MVLTFPFIIFYMPFGSCIVYRDDFLLAFHEVLPLRVEQLRQRRRPVLLTYADLVERLVDGGKMPKTMVMLISEFPWQGMPRERRRSTITIFPLVQI